MGDTSLDTDGDRRARDVDGCWFRDFRSRDADRCRSLETDRRRSLDPLSRDSDACRPRDAFSNGVGNLMDIKGMGLLVD